MPTPYLLIEHLTKSVGSKVLFEDISFAVNEGQRIALIARNGIGKSTLLDIIAGKTDYDEGKITFRNALSRTCRSREHTRRREKFQCRGQETRQHDNFSQKDRSRGNG